MMKFKTHLEFFEYLDKTVTKFKLDVIKNHDDLSKCEIHVAMQCAEFLDKKEVKTAIGRMRATIDRVN